MSEIWKVCPSDANYEVSSLGNVRRVNGRILKPWDNNGYRQIALSKRRREHIHRLVAEAFIPKDDIRNQINHINGVRSDNRVENLERCTPSENQRHRYEVLQQKGTCIGRFSKEHPSSKPVSAIRLVNGEQYDFDCGLDAIRAGIATDSGSITRCCQGKIRHHNGFVWSYA